MVFALEQPTVGELPAVLDVLRAWQDDALPLQLHPGDLGWYWRYGVDAVAEHLRVGRHDGHLIAIGLLDDDVLRLTMAPELSTGDARLIAAALPVPESSDELIVELPNESPVRDALRENGWQIDESWTPLSFDLRESVEDPRIRVEVVGPDEVPLRVAVQRAAFPKSSFTEERWQAMAGGPAYADARCLIGYDDAGVGVATVTVWSAGPGKPGLIEPMGVHHEHRGRGYGRAMNLAALQALQELGSSSALVCTPSENTGAVAAYASAGFVPQPERRDLRWKS